MSQFVDVKGLVLNFCLMGIQLCQFEKLIDQFAEPLTVLDGNLQMMLAVFGGQAFIL